MALTEINSLGIKDGEVKTADLAADAVTSAKIADGTIVNADINASAAIALSKLASTPAVLSGSTDNTVCTVTGANAITGESNVHINGGIVIAGHTASTTTSQGEGPFFQAKSTDSRAGLSCIRHSDDASGGGVYLGKSRNGTIGSHTVVQDNDELGRITWSGDDGTDIHSIAARIDAHIDGTPGSNDMPGRLGFWTTADGAHNPTERMRIAQNGNVGIGTGSVLTDPDNLLHMESSSDFAIHLLKTSIASGMIRNKGNIDIAAASGGATGQLISFSNGANTGSLTERGRIDGSGYLLWGCTTQDSNNSTGIRMTNAGSIFVTRDAEYALVLRRSSSDGGTILFRRDSTDVGNISVTSSATSYNTGSDYRLKQDDEPISDGITRLKQLKPIKFKWKNDTSKFVDGFFAHEVSSVVPESITGTKDEMQDVLYTAEDTIPSGKKVGDVKETVPKYQGIDQGKLVPLLTAALQEAITEIETLKTKVAALEAA